MKRLFKDKRGMTLMEILVALSLLLIVIVGTTPVMLSAYDGLYLAGEKTKETYDAKSEMEDILATRNTNEKYDEFEISLKNVGENFNAVGEVASINAKRAVSSLYTTLETIFVGGRAHLAIVSSKVINDDKTTQTVVLQTTNIAITNPEIEVSQNSPTNIKSTPEANKNNQYKVDFSAYLPDKTETDLANIYGSKKATVKVKSVNTATGRIEIELSGMDFTTSPVKIQATYVDENYKKKTTHCYLTVKTPTIMLAGETVYGKYYTSAGLEKKTAQDGTTYNVFKVEPRNMRIDGAANTKKMPDKTVIKSVNWVTEELNGEFVTEDILIDGTRQTLPYEPSYYVLTGTNGAIYRTYTFKNLNEVKGKVDLSIPSGVSTTGFTNKYHKILNQRTTTENLLGITENHFYLDDSQSTVVYPAVWGGDFSHIFGYAAYEDQAGYTNRTSPSNSSLAWYTEDTTTNGIGIPGFYSNFASFSYYYNGWGLNTPYHSANSKKISYILTEMPYAMRVGGLMGDVGSVTNWGYDGSTFDRIWEQPNSPDGSSHLGEMDDLKFRIYEWFGATYAEGWYYGGPDKDYPRSMIVSSNTNDDKDFGIIDSKNYKLQTLPVYFVNNGGDGKRRKDNGFAQLRIKALTTVSPTIVYTKAGTTETDRDQRLLYETDKNQSKIIVTDALYLPKTSKTSGGMFYIGTVAAYAWVTQVDNCGTNDEDPDVKNIENTDTSNTGWPSFYWIKSNSDGTSTTIFKQTIHDDSTDITWDNYRKSLINDAALTEGTTEITANETASHQFFISQPTSASGRLFSDVCFTMGFTSNREMVYTNIVYGRNSSGLVMSLKFCEPLYFKSHYDDADHLPNLYMNGNTDTDGDSHKLIYNKIEQDSLNSEHNDYYNVWFPGEMYNLTKVATKDDVTVAVGYAVAGSSYSFLNTVQNASTGLGGVFNDGVLAGMILGEDSAFTNLLYFKDNATMDKTSLSDGSVGVIGANGMIDADGNPDTQGERSKTYKDLFGGDYGTHVRNSVQFTAVDISVEHIKTADDKEIVTYYAYYADNFGRLYKSKIATKETAKGATTSGKTEMVSHIADESYNVNRSASSFMEKVLVNGNEVGTYFSKITSVKCEGDFIFVSGYPKTGATDKYNVVVGYIKQTTNKDGSTSNTVHWRVLTINSGDTTPTVTNLNQTETSFTLDGVLYLAGSFKNQQTVNSVNYRGWVYALPIATVREAFADIFYTDKTDAEGNVTTAVTPVTSITALSSHYVLTQDRLYAGDGHTSD